MPGLEFSNVGGIFATPTALYLSLEPGLVARLVDGADAPVVLASGLENADFFGTGGDSLYFAVIPNRYRHRPYASRPVLVKLPLPPDHR